MYVFGYGSLLWYTNFPYEEAITGVVYGYARRFWHLSPEHRGTPDKPGRVVSLVPQKDEVTWGIAYKVPADAIQKTIEYLDFREKAGYERSQVKFWPDDGSEAFDLDVYISLNINDNIYYGPADENVIAEQIMQCKGMSGSNLEYALRLADVQRRLAPHFKDDHLFGIESRLLRLCSSLNHRDEILDTLNYKIGFSYDSDSDSSGKENNL